jgi:hypothetical protein
MPLAVTTNPFSQVPDVAQPSTVATQTPPVSTHSLEMTVLSGYEMFTATTVMFHWPIFFGTFLTRNDCALFTKVKTGQGVSSEYVQRVIKGTDDETISDNIVAILPYTESRLERNDVVISDIKKKLEEIESGR